MAEDRNRQAWIGLGALALGLLVAGGVLVWTGPGGSGSEPSTPDGTQPSDPSKAPPATTQGGDGEGRNPLTANEPVVVGDGGKAAAKRVAESTTEGPVGEVTAASLPTVAAPMPPGNLSLIQPRFSPTGKRVVALSTGSGGRTAWVLESDAVNAGWIAADTGGPVTEVDWIDDETLAYVRDGQLFSWRSGGRSFAVVGPADEPGTMSHAVASPDGSKVAYVSTTTTNGGGDIRVVDRTTAVVRNLTSTRARVIFPSWRADGLAVTGVVDGQVNAWALDQSDPIAAHARLDPARNPGFWGSGLVWQEGGSFVVDVAYAPEGENPRILARQALASITRPAPVVADRVWVASLKDPGTLWAVGPDGDALIVDTDADYATQPDVVKRANGIWVAFTNNTKSQGITHIHLGRLDPSLLVD